MGVLAGAIGVGAVVALGLSAGALLAEAAVLVPFWRSEPPEAFLAWYQRNADRLLRFFGPLEVASGALVLVACVLAWAGVLPGAGGFTLAALLTLAVLASFPLYFKDANASFAEASIPVDAVPAELARWGRWHSARTLASIVAFLAAMLGLLAPA